MTTQHFRWMRVLLLLLLAGCATATQQRAQTMRANMAASTAELRTCSQTIRLPWIRLETIYRLI